MEELDKYYVQANDGIKFALTVQQLQPYPTLTDIIQDVEPNDEENPIIIPSINSELLTSIFNKTYLTTSLNLLPLIEIIIALDYLGYDHDLIIMVRQLEQYFYMELTPEQKKLVQSYVIQYLNANIIAIIFDHIKKLGVDYTTRIVSDDPNYTNDYDLELVSPNLDHVVVRKLQKHPQEKIGAYTYYVLPLQTRLLYNKQQYIREDLDENIYKLVDNNGTMYTYIRRTEGVEIVTNNNGTITKTVENIAPGLVMAEVFAHPSKDGSKYMYRAENTNTFRIFAYIKYANSTRPPLRFPFIYNVVSALLNTFISEISRDHNNYTIYHIENHVIQQHVVTMHNKYRGRSIYFRISYSGKTIAQVKYKCLTILNTNGEILGTKALAVYDEVLTLSDKYVVILANVNDKKELQLWPIENLDKSFTVSKLDLGNYTGQTEAVNGEQQDQFLIVFTSKGNNEQRSAIQWYKFKLDKFQDMAELYQSLGWPTE